MELNFKVLQPEDVSELLDYEADRHKELYPDPEVRMFTAWQSRARQESLEHYCRLGWSFKAQDTENRLQGFMLAQPLLFVSGHTQSLWVEHVSTASLKVRDGLVDLAYRLAREKHLQGVYFPNQQSLLNGLARGLAQSWAEAPVFVSLVKK